MSDEFRTEWKEQEGEDFEYVLLCNKICGAAHYNMQMNFIVETQEEYDSWIASKKTLSEKQAELRNMERQLQDQEEVNYN